MNHPTLEAWSCLEPLFLLAFFFLSGAAEKDGQAWHTAATGVARSKVLSGVYCQGVGGIWEGSYVLDSEF